MKITKGMIEAALAATQGKLYVQDMHQGPRAIMRDQLSAAIKAIGVGVDSRSSYMYTAFPTKELPPGEFAAKIIVDNLGNAKLYLVI